MVMNKGLIFENFAIMISEEVPHGGEQTSAADLGCYYHQSDTTIVFSSQP